MSLIKKICHLLFIYRNKHWTVFNLPGIFFSFIFLFLMHIPLWAVLPYQPTMADPILELWPWRLIPELKGEGVLFMIEGRQDCVWFDVEQGSVRYDGLNWTKHFPKDNSIGSPVLGLCISNNGSVYASLPEGVSRFKDGVWEMLLVYQTQYPSNRRMRSIVQYSDGSVWARLKHGVLYTKDGNFFVPRRHWVELSDA